MAVTTNEHGGWVVVALHGDADFHTGTQIAAALDRARATSPWLVVDCSLLTFWDSGFLGTLVNAYKQARARGGALVVAAAPDRLARQLDRTGLAQVIATYPTVAEAVA